MKYKLSRSVSQPKDSEKFFRRTLTNGLTVVGEYHPDLRKASMGILIPRGSAHDPSYLPGAHHFLEHVLFKSQTSKHRKGIIEGVEDVGGITNATTTYDCTEVFCDVPVNKYLEGIRFLTELSFNPPTAKGRELSIEGRVVREEQRMYEDQLSEHASDLLHQTVFTKPFGRAVFGTRTAISAMTRRDMLRIWAESYNPADFIFSMVGGIHPDKFVQELEKNLPRKIGSKSSDLDFPVDYRFNHRTLKRRGIKQCHIAIGVPNLTGKSERLESWAVLDAFLCEGASSVLFSSIREDRGLIYRIEHGPMQWKRVGLYELETSTSNPRDIELIESLVLKGFEKAASMTHEQFVALKERALGIEDVVESSLNERRSLLAESEFKEGEALEHYRTRDNISKVTLTQVRNVAKQALQGYSSVRILQA